LARKLQEVVGRIERIEQQYGSGTLNERDERVFQEIIERLDYLEERLRIEKGDSGPLSPNKHLHMAIAGRFNEAELRQLAFLMNTNLEDIGGDGHSDRSLQFCLFIDRHGRTCELVSLLENLRPSINWRRWCPEGR